MPIFNYKALQQDGKVISGSVDAPNISLAEGALLERDFKVIDIQEKEIMSGVNLKFLSFLNRIKQKDLVVFSRQLSVMISATVPIIQALKNIAKQVKNSKFRNILNDVAYDVDGGMKLSDALKKHKIFDNFFVNMVATGETSGKLDEVLEYLADEIEKSYDLQSKIKGAMMYPAFIISGMILVAIAMMIFIIPNLVDIIEEAGQELPLPTRILIAFSDFLTHKYVYLIIIIAIVFGSIYYFTKKTESGKKFINLLKLRVPIFGRLWQNIYVVRFSGSLSSLISAGVPLTNALRITAEVIDNYYYKKLIDETIRKVEDGYSMADTFSKSNIFPTMVIQMIRTGEKTGRLNVVLDRIESFYSREAKNMVDNLTSLLEPIIMVVIGIGVAFVVAAVLMPMYSMTNAM